MRRAAHLIVLLTWLAAALFVGLVALSAARTHSPAMPIEGARAAGIVVLYSLGGALILLGLAALVLPRHRGVLAAAGAVWVLQTIALLLVGRVSGGALVLAAGVATGIAMLVLSLLVREWRDDDRRRH